MEEVCQNVEAALSSKDEDSQSVNKNYISFFSNMEKVLLDNFKDGKAKKEKLSFMYCKEETDTLQHVLPFPSQDLDFKCHILK
jgi:hypothetical protein